MKQHLVAVLAALTVAAPAQAGWSPAFDLKQGERAWSGAVVAVAPNGDAVASWEAFFPTRVFATFRRGATGAWSAPAVVATDRQRGLVRFAPDGTAHVLAESPNTVSEARLLPGAGAFTPAADLVSTGDRSLMEYDLVFADGQAHLIFRDQARDGTTAVVRARSGPSTSTLGAPVTLDDTGRPQRPVVGTDGRRIVLAYPDAAGSFRLVRREPGGPWQRPLAFETGTEDADRPWVSDVPVTATGRAAVLLGVEPGGADRLGIRAVPVPAGQGPGAPAEVLPPIGRSMPAVTAVGDAIVVAMAGTDDRLRVVTDTDGAPGTPQVLCIPGVPTGAAADAEGRVHVLLVGDDRTRLLRLAPGRPAAADGTADLGFGRLGLDAAGLATFFGSRRGEGEETFGPYAATHDGVFAERIGTEAGCGPTQDAAAPPAPPAPSTSPVAAVPPAPPTSPGPAAEQARCLGFEVALLDARPTGRAVRVRGFALPAYAGRPVRIVAGGRTVGRSVVGRDGGFEVRVARAKRYVARVGGATSRSFKAERRLRLDRLRGTVAGVRLSGRVVAPSARRPARLQLTRQPLCGTVTSAGTVRLRRDGRFSLTLPAAGVSGLVVYRLKARLRGGRTFSVPVIVR